MDGAGRQALQHELLDPLAQRGLARARDDGRASDWVPCQATFRGVWPLNERQRSMATWTYLGSISMA